MEKARRTLGLVTLAAAAVYAVSLIVLAVWAFSGSIHAPVRSPILLIIGVPLLGGSLAWTGHALRKSSTWAQPASTLAAGAAAGLVLFAFALELTWRWKNPTAVTSGPPLDAWGVVVFLAYPAALHLLVRVVSGPKPEPGPTPTT